MNASCLLAISSVFENVAFFGDLLIRIHDIVKQVCKLERCLFTLCKQIACIRQSFCWCTLQVQVYKRNSDWHEILKWSVDFCNSTYLYQGMAHQKHIHIVSTPNRAHHSMLTIIQSTFLNLKHADFTTCMLHTKLNLWIFLQLSMEIGFIPMDPDYHNPFKVKSPPKRSDKKSKSHKNKRERKPQLSNHIELQK